MLQLLSEPLLQLGDRLVLAVAGPQSVRIARSASAMLNATFASVLALPGQR